jgi:molecular chaperone DnaK
MVGIILIRWIRAQEAAPPAEFRVTPTTTNTMVGDERSSQALAALLLDRASEEFEVSLIDDVLVRQRIAQAAARAMNDLHADGSATVSLPFLVADAKGPKHFEVRVIRKPDGTLELQQ